jgi:hypothetical protein
VVHASSRSQPFSFVLAKFLPRKLRRSSRSTRSSLKNSTFFLPLILKSFNGWLLVPSALFLSLFLWQWKLVLALTVGAVAMVLVYRWERQDWQGWAMGLRRWFSGPQRLLVLSVGSGGVAALGTYLTASVWVDEGNPWMASEFLLQGLGTLAVLLLLVMQWLNHQGESFETRLESAVQALSDPDPLKRLLGIRQIDRFILKKNLDAAQLKLVTGALQILVKQEPEAAVRNAALDSLQGIRMPNSEVIRWQMNTHR